MMLRLLNFWRLRSYTEDGVTVECYDRRNGVTVITRIKAA